METLTSAGLRHVTFRAQDVTVRLTALAVLVPLAGSHLALNHTTLPWI